MAGRKPIVDDRKKNSVTMYVTDEELKILDKFIRSHERGMSRAWFLHRVIFKFINGDYVEKEDSMKVERLINDSRSLS